MSLLASMFKVPEIEQDYRQRTEAFLDDMKNLANPRDLYRYAKEEIEEAEEAKLAGRGAGAQQTSQVADAGTAVSRLPGFVGWTASKMPRQGLILTQDGVKYVNLTWSRGDDRWGIMVGPPDFEPADTTGLHVLHWADGIYVWHEVRPSLHDIGRLR